MKNGPLPNGDVEKKKTKRAGPSATARKKSKQKAAADSKTAKSNKALSMTAGLVSINENLWFLQVCRRKVKLWCVLAAGVNTLLEEPF